MRSFIYLSFDKLRMRVGGLVKSLMVSLSNHGLSVLRSFDKLGMRAITTNSSARADFSINGRGEPSQLSDPLRECFDKAFAPIIGLENCVDSFAPP